MMRVRTAMAHPMPAVATAMSRQPTRSFSSSSDCGGRTGVSMCATRRQSPSGENLDETGFGTRTLTGPRIVA